VYSSFFLLPVTCLCKLFVDELNVCWNSVVQRSFGYHKWESVSAVLFGLGRLNIKHLLGLHEVIQKSLCNDCVFLHNMFLTFLMQNFAALKMCL